MYVTIERRLKGQTIYRINGTGQRARVAVDHDGNMKVLNTNNMKKRAATRAVNRWIQKQLDAIAFDGRYAQLKQS